MADVLFYFPGSPFARMARVLVREWGLPVETEELGFPPPDELFDLNPLGQVPVLRLSDGRCLAPTLIVLEHLALSAGHAKHIDRQQLLTILQAGDAMVSAKYQDWSGLGPVRPNAVGYDPGERNMARFHRVLDWAETGLAAGAIPTGIVPSGVALACLLLWLDARGGPDWRSRRRLDALVSSLERRPSFRDTAPQPWAP